MTVYTKDPSSILDYAVDWTLLLAVGESISTVAWDVPAGLSLIAQSKTNTTAVVRLGGGTNVSLYTVGCIITTTTGQVDVRSFVILCQDR